MSQLYFEYPEEAVQYLKSKDAKLAQAIDVVGHVYRKRNPDLFSEVIHTIIAQQISTSAAQTVSTRIIELIGEVTPERILLATPESLQSCGTTFKKVEYMQDFARRVQSGQFDIEALESMSDADAIQSLCTLKGIGVWTAEMLLLFCLNRMDIFSFGDLGIHRGVRMVYHHRAVTKEMWEKYRRRFRPYGSVASLYFWAISHMDVPGYSKDYAPKKKTS